MILYTKSHMVPFQIDDSQHERVLKYTWHFQRYIRAGINGKIVRLHNFLFGKVPEGLEWDHIDRDPLNNKRSNLRLVRHSENMRNKKVPKNNKSGTKGVHWEKSYGNWRAMIKKDGKMYHIGCYKNLDDAISARKLKEIELFGG